jgi:hypothetical protein
MQRLVNTAKRQADVHGGFRGKCCSHKGVWRHDADVFVLIRQKIN